MNYKLLIGILLVGLLVGVASAEERVTNGDFETGDLTGWIQTGNGDVSNYNPHSGTYGFHEGASGSMTGAINQSVNFTGISYLSFWYYSWSDSDNQSFTVKIDSDTVYSSTSEVDPYQQFFIDTTSYSGNHTLKFEFALDGGGVGCEFDLDDISVQPTTGIISVYPVTFINETKILPNSDTNLPAAGYTVSINATPGQFEASSFIIKPNTTASGINITATDLTDGSGHTIYKNATTIKLVKAWYQQDEDNIWVDPAPQYILAPELLLNNDSIVRVNYTLQQNELWVKNATFEGYVHIDNTSIDQWQSDYKVYDNATAEGFPQRFSLSDDENKQIWLTTHVPTGQAAGNYTGKVWINSTTALHVAVNLSVRVLPFTLVNSTITHSLYYVANSDNSSDHYRTDSNMLIELQDIKDHSVSYPLMAIRSTSNPDTLLEMRNTVGFPKDKIFIFGQEGSSYIGNGTSPEALAAIASGVIEWRNITGTYGYTDTYFYGMDELYGDELVSQRPAWQTVHNNSGKMYVALGWLNDEAVDLVGDILDIAIYADEYNSTQAALWHGYGNELYIYNQPQVGVENPEVYRQTYGVALWSSGYDGAMNFAYAHLFGQSIWNDYDTSNIRDHVFAYPKTDGVIDTIQWEGYRQGIDDSRYADTLTAYEGNNTTALSIINDGIADGDDMLVIRSNMIDAILASDMTADPPVADFTANVTSGAAPLAIQFTDTSTNTPTSWSWAYKNETVGWTAFSTTQTATYSFPTGLYDINLTATNIWGSDDEIKLYYINSGGSITLYAANDGIVSQTTNSNWAPMRGGAGESVENNPAETMGSEIVTSTNTNKWDYFDRVLLTFNVSELNGKTINSAKLYFKHSYTETDISDEQLCLIDAYPASPTTFVAGDYDGTSYTKQGTCLDFEYSASAYWDSITLTNFTGLNSGTYKTYMFDMGSSVDNVTPTWVNGLGNDYEMYSSSYSGGTAKPYMVINYSAGTAIPPASAFSANVTQGATPLSVGFTDASTNIPTTWKWYWYANETVSSTSQNPTTTLTTGLYSVRLNSSNTYGNDWENKTNYINVTTVSVTPIADFSSNVTGGAAPLIVKFTDTSINTPTVWNWWARDTYPVGNDTVFTFSTEQNPVHTFSQGNWLISLNASNSFGFDTALDHIWINVTGSSQIPVAHFYMNISTGV